MRKLQVFLILLVTAIIAIAAVSCAEASSKTSGAAVTSSADTEAETTGDETLSELDQRKAIPDDLPETDFGGTKLRIACEESKAYEIAADQIDGEVLNDSVYERNARIADRFNSTIDNIIVVDAHANVVKTVSAGDDAYDLVGYKAYLSYKAITAGCVQNWYHIPYVNLQKPWYNQITNDGSTFNGKLYNNTCSLGISSMQYTYAMFANDRICESYEWPVTKLYGLVDDGKWTYDQFLTLVNLCYTDVNGDGTKDVDDVFGYASGNTHPLDAWLAAFDQPITSKDKDGNVIIDLMTDKTVSALEKVYDMMYNDPSVYFFNAEYKEFTKFAQCTLMFCPAPFRIAYSELRTMEDGYAMLPMPKWDEAQEKYLTNIYDQYSVFSVPKTVPTANLEFVGIMTEVLNAESYKTVYPAFYDTALKNKYSQDADSARMVDLVMAGTGMDFAYMFGETNMQRVPYLFRDCINNKTTDIASKYAKLESKLATSLPKLYGYYENDD